MGKSDYIIVGYQDPRGETNDVFAVQQGIDLNRLELQPDIFVTPTYYATGPEKILIVVRKEGYHPSRPYRGKMVLLSAL
jgi:hypothetical protein